MVKVLRIGHATFETPDLAKAIEHYTQVIGLSLAGREDKRAFLVTKVGQLVIELRQGAQACCAKLSFEVAANSDFADLRRELQKHGVAAEERNDSVPGVPKVLSFQDPKGTEIELFREWSFLGNHEQVVGVGALKLGHVAFVTPEPKMLAEFYGKVLGFRVSDWIGDFFVFMRCNADHHAVNFISGQNIKMHHIAFELRDFSHLQTACDLFGERKIPIIWGPVRLGPGHNVAAFHRDHDDWVVEFYGKVLGFRVSDWIGDFFVFMRCNPDHHTVNFIKGKCAKMHHIAFELKDFGHLQTACELFGARGIPIIWGPVRLGPGHNVAVFHRTPDDQVVELYAELDQMKDEELGYFDPRPWHHDRPQRPKVWDAKKVAYMWGPPPTADFMRSRD